MLEEVREVVEQRNIFIDREETDVKSTDVLRHEHKIVLGVIGGAEREAESIRATGRTDADKIAKIVEFLRDFVDKCHHSKEERQLFPKLQELGMRGDVGPIAVMLHEHAEGRKLVAAIADALAAFEQGNAGAASVLAEHLVAYADLLRAHIAKEDNVLFSMADDRLSDADQADLCQAFDAIETSEIGKGVHERYHQFAHDLMKR